MTDKEIMEALITGKTFVHASGTECEMVNNNLSYTQSKDNLPCVNSFPSAKDHWKIKKRTVYVNLYDGSEAYQFSCERKARENARDFPNRLSAVAVPIEIDE